MCRRFAAVRTNVTGSSNDVGAEGAGQSSGLVPGGMPKGTTSPVGRWPVADIALGLADRTVGGPTDEPHTSVLTLGVEAL
jgi:hypothetical protein